MHLRRIRIPDYRVLQDVDLRFDPGLSPQVFPLGSENGGGKSTLLQLVFVLLHCWWHRQRLEFLRTMMSLFDHPPDLAEKLVAEIELWDGNKAWSIEFVSLSGTFLREALGSEAPPEGFEALSPGKGHRNKRSADKIRELLDAKQYRVSWYSRGSDDDPLHYVLAVRGQDADRTQLLELLRQCRKSIFLLAPSSQTFLFLARASRKAFITRSQDDESQGDLEEDYRSPLVTYLQELEDAAERMPGFFAYDWISVDALLDLFSQARDQDFAQAIKAGGQYGTAYPDMLRDVNTLLRGKRVRPLEDLSGVEFLVDGPDGRERILGPEDLSRGELKRLMIFAWLRADVPEDAIVLVDEIEISFHPDWQFRIVRDLVEWAPTAQFVLATHSHEVCQAVTPAHVRELQPVLAKRDDDGASS